MKNEAYSPIDRTHCEYLRSQAKARFDQVRGTWIDLGRWALPHRIKWMLSQTEGERNNQHIVDPTHVLALRSYVAGFLEGNTSATRPWYRIGTADPELDVKPDNKEWLEKFARQTFKALYAGNFYHAAGEFYYDYGTFNTGSYYIDERPNGTLYFHVLTPGSYFVINNSYGEAVVMIREMSLNVKALVSQYGKKVKGEWDWSNFSSRVKKLYEDASYGTMIDVVHIVMENPDFDANKVQAGSNRRWLSMTYESSANTGPNFAGTTFDGGVEVDNEKYLKISSSKRKPFIIGKSQSSGNFEYGEKGPTSDAISLIKSLNKKAIGKDQALEQMLRPPLQGPASLKKSYITTAANSYVPLDANSLSKNGLRPIFEVNPAITAIVQDVSDMRQQVRSEERRVGKECRL